MAVLDEDRDGRVQWRDILRALASGRLQGMQLTASFQLRNLSQLKSRLQEARIEADSTASAL